MGGSEAIGLGEEALERDEGDDMGEIGDGTSTSMILFQIHVHSIISEFENLIGI